MLFKSRYNEKHIDKCQVTWSECQNGSGEYGKEYDARLEPFVLVAQKCFCLNKQNIANIYERNSDFYN